MIFNVGSSSYEWRIIPTCPASANQSINSTISPDRRLCRFAKVSGHPAISRIAVYFGSPKYRAIYLISTGISQIFIDFADYHDPSVTRVYQNIIASISRGIKSKNI